MRWRYLASSLLLGCALAGFVWTAEANQINTVLYQDTTIGGAEARLPIIDGSADENVENQANELLLKAAKNVARAVGNQGSVSYKVTLNRPSLLSVLLEAENGDAHAYEAVNIDMASGQTFGLHDFYMDVDATKEEFKDAKDVLFSEKGIYKQLKKEGEYGSFISYSDMYPFMRIGEAGRLVQIARMTDKAEGKTLVMEKCGLAAFKLESNPTTGYTWNLATSPAYEHKVEKVGSSFIIPGYKQENTAVGQSSMEILMVAMMAPGTYDVQLEYRRPWERTAAKKKHFNVIVKDY